MLSHGIFVNRRMGDKLQSHLKDQVLGTDWILPTWFVSVLFKLCVCVYARMLSHVWLFETLWTVACQGPLSMGFAKQEYWSRLPCPSPGDLPSPGIKPGSPAMQADPLPSEPPGKPILWDNHFCRWHCADKENEALKVESSCLIKIYRTSDRAGILWPSDHRAWTRNHRDILPNLSQIDVSYYCFYDSLLSKR